MKRFTSTFSAISLMITMLLMVVFPVQASTTGFTKQKFHNPLKINNRYYPLQPNTTLTYAGTTDGDPTLDTFVITNQTKTILGIQTRIVHDTAYTNGILEEDTFDWFAQDDAGNVWYFGEDTTPYNPDGSVAGHEGSWEAGVNGARAGIIMKARPHIGDTYKQEIAVGVAQDSASVLSLRKSVCVPYGCFKHLLQTKEFSPLEPGVVEHKYYATGIGKIKALLVRGGSEETHLVKIEHK